MKQTVFRGSAAALVTPMKEDSSIDYNALGCLLDMQLTGGTDAVVVAATTGEGSTLTDSEQAAVIQYTVDRVKGRLPVIAGAGSNCTAHAVELSREAERMGADALLHVTPYYNKASQTGLYKHFRACAAAVSIPVILYNVPQRTGVNLLPETCKKLSEVENIVALKEAGGNISQLAKTAALCGDALDIYSGNDDQITAALALGAKGVISVLANIAPGDTHEICQSYFEGDFQRSNMLQFSYLELVEALFSDVNPIPVKQALNYMGYRVGGCRLPLCDMDEARKAKLLEVMKKYRLCMK